MRYILSFIIVAALSFSGAKAQEVYNLVLNNATRIVNSPVSSYTQTQIAQFKRTALVYLKSKAFEESDTVPSAFLDTQAYYLSEFITLYFDQIVKLKKVAPELRKERIVLFMDASASNPLFEDKDEETTMAYVKDENELTPFSLDTDWQKAYAAVKSQLKK